MKGIFIVLFLTVFSNLNHAQKISYFADSWINFGMYSKEDWTTAAENPIFEKIVVTLTNTHIIAKFGKREKKYLITKRISKGGGARYTDYLVTIGPRKFTISIAGIPTFPEGGEKVKYYLITCSSAKDKDDLVWATGDIRRMETE